MNKEDILKKTEGLFKKISPPVPVGGLQITDFAVRYAGMKGGRIFSESLRLQPGVVESGRVKNSGALAAVLAELRKRVIPDPKKPISVVLSLSIRDIYIQTFTTPQVGEENFEEAADLNARMMSPINAESAYYGWQRVSEKVTASTNVDMLGAFIQKPVVDEFVNAVEAAGFGIVAIEFESMSLARSINNAKLVEEGKSYIIVLVAAEGISMVVVRRGIPHFHYFHPWSEVQGNDKSVSTDKFKSVLGDELERVTNFYFTHWSGDEVQDVVFVTPFFEEGISSLMKEKFPHMKAQIIDTSRASVAVGAALRGNIPRSSDKEISLASLSALGVFEQQQVRNFIKIWRNILATSLGFLLLIFVAANIFLRFEISRLLVNEGELPADAGIEEFIRLTKEADEFNKLVSEIAGVRSDNVDVASFLEEIRGIAGDGINLTRLAFNPSESSILVNGVAPNEGAAVDFKNRLAGNSRFRDVNLPLHNIVSVGSGVSFSLDFKVNGADLIK